MTEELLLCIIPADIDRRDAKESGVNATKPRNGALCTHGDSVSAESPAGLSARSFGEFEGAAP